MIPPFNIFRSESDGGVWLSAAATLEEAGALVEELTVDSPVEYFIRNVRTGDNSI